MELKEQIARKALEYVKDGDTIAIDSGTVASRMFFSISRRRPDTESMPSR